MNGSMDGDDGCIKCSFMVKRALMKRKFLTTDNYKSRWFRLYPQELKYYDGTLESGIGREKGCITLSNIRVIEEADLAKVDRQNGFQVWYDDPAQTNTSTLKLYVCAQTKVMKEEWISTLRSVCKNLGIQFANKYHPGVWTPKYAKFTCCQQDDRDAPACTPAFNNDIATPQHQQVIEPPERTLPRITGSERKSPIQSRKPKSPKTTRKLMPPASPIRPRRDVSPSPRHTPSSSPFPTRRFPEEPTSKKSLPPPPQQIVETPSPPLAVKSVVAMYDYKAANSEDLEIKKGEKLEIIDDQTEEYWWKARNATGDTGFIPANYVMDAGSQQNIDDYPWFFRDLTRQRSELVLKTDGREGCFLVRMSAQSESYTVGIYTKEGGDDGTVRHYHVKKVRDGPNAGRVYLHPQHPQQSIEGLIAYHKQNSAGLVTRLRNFPQEQLESPATVGLRHGTSVIDANDLEMVGTLGKGNFGCVEKALYRKQTYVAVKMTQAGMMADQDFIDEAKTMMQLQHPNLVQLYGVCEKPLYIVTEFMEQGALLDYLKKKRTFLLPKTGMLLDICLQVVKGMEHLEKKGFIHRDLAARNCLVAKNGTVKVADFGLSRHVVDDEYTAGMGAKFPIRWASPEVLSFTKFSSKSDVWAYGVLMWEVFTGGEMPYHRMRNPEVVAYVNQRRQRLQKPPMCPGDVYTELMIRCWDHTETLRPNFTECIGTLTSLMEKLNFPQ